MRRVYLDNLATTQPAKEVYLAMLPYFRKNFGNALSPYELGTIAREAIEGAREEVAKLINASPKDVIFYLWWDGI
jgi:cysteine desulfurase